MRAFGHDLKGNNVSSKETTGPYIVAIDKVLDTVTEGSYKRFLVSN